jgi:hypothetical protein
VFEASNLSSPSEYVPQYVVEIDASWLRVFCVFRFKINIRYSKTFARNIPLPLCNSYLNAWLSKYPQRNDPEAQLFPIRYKSLVRKIRMLAEKVLKKRVTPHTLRHSSATYWAPKMNRYQLCAKYGWAFSSNMPDRYIEGKGIIFEKIAEKGDTD